jgi:hypothetical protein
VDIHVGRARKRTGFACLIVASAAVLLGASIAGQGKAVSPDLVKLGEGKGLGLNRTLSVISDGTKKGVHPNEGPTTASPILRGTEFSDGAIEFDLRGKGAATELCRRPFHGVDGAT